MNRLGPLITRRVGAPATRAVAIPIAGAPEPSSALLDDLRTFALVWLGGLVFFGTYIA